MEGAARETGIPVVISSRYRPNSAALSLVPRATRTTRRGRCFSTRRLNFSTLRNSAERVRSSASGCCRISSSIRDIDLKIAGVAVGGGVTARRFAALYQRSIPDYEWLVVGYFEVHARKIRSKAGLG